MKGVLLQQTDARLVDIAHDFPRQDIQATAFWLREVLPYFPPAVHLVVVDPGVGTDRNAVVLRSGNHAIVAPDNGVAMPAARALSNGHTSPTDSTTESRSVAECASSGVDVFEIQTDDPASTTFHGRDVFAPAAADIHELGIERFHEHDRYTPLEQPVNFSFPNPTISDTGAYGEVLVVDDFGNAITNLPGRLLAERFGEPATVNGESVPAEQTYAAVDAGEGLVTVGSHGNVELAANKARGDEAFDVTQGSQVELSW